MKLTYNHGYADGLHQAIDFYSKAKHCETCGGQTHGQQSFELGKFAARLNRYQETMLVVLGTVWWSLMMLAMFMLMVHMVGGTYMKAVDMMHCSSLK